MTLQIKHGDLLANATSDCIIIHGVNCQGKMASGFAEKIRSMYPQCYAAYKRVEMKEGLHLGEVSTVSFMNGLIIGNAITQERYGRDKSVVYVDYKAVEKALNKAADHSRKTETPIHLPFIGGGLANGDKQTLMAIFERVFHDVDATLWIYDDAVIQQKECISDKNNQPE